MVDKSLLVIDGMAVLYRSYFSTLYSNQVRETTYGQPTNAVYKFVQYLFDAMKTFGTTHVVVCWDVGKANFRNEVLSSYKANREKAPEKLIEQIPLVKLLMDSLSVPNIGLRGYEGDDCIGTLVKRYEHSMPVIVLTGDYDMLQLISNSIFIAIMKSGLGNYKIYSPDTLFREKGLISTQIVDLKAFQGDSSDNYPGVEGIGEKTALKLLWQYKDVRGVIKNLHRIPFKIRHKIESNIELLLVSLEVAKIECNVPIDCSIDECIWSPNIDIAGIAFRKLEMLSLLDKANDIKVAT